MTKIFFNSITLCIAFTLCSCSSNTLEAPQHTENVSAPHTLDIGQHTDFLPKPSKEWVAVNFHGMSHEQVEKKLGKPWVVGDVPPDDIGGYYLVYGKNLKYRIHYSWVTNQVTKAFKRIDK